MPVSVNIRTVIQSDVDSIVSQARLETANDVGWIQYNDTQYTSTSPLAVAAGVWTTIPNNAGTVIDAYAPANVSLYDGTKITPDQVGDGIFITVNFKAASQQAETACQFAIDIGGTIGRIFPRTFTCADSAGSEKEISFSFSGYTLDTWKANGGFLQIKAEHAIDIYGANLITGRYSKG